MTTPWLGGIAWIVLAAIIRYKLPDWLTGDDE